MTNRQDDSGVLRERHVRTKQEKVWVVISPSGHTKSGAFPQRKTAVHEAIPGCMGNPEYNDLGDDDARWKYLHRRGFRVVPATLTWEPTK